MTIINNEFVTGTCTWCGDSDVCIYPDTMRCEDCDRDVIRCSICNEDQSRDNRCRHVFEDSDYNWNGSGIGDPDEGIQDAFFKLLILMPAGFAEALREAIKSGGFHTWMVSPLIGSGGFLTLYGMPRGEQRWGDRMIEIGEGEYADDVADGYHWLASLYNADTPRANQTTIEWLDDWIAPKPLRPAKSDRPVDRSTGGLPWRSR